MRIPRAFAMLLAAASFASAQLVISHMSASTANPTNQPKPYLKIANLGATAVDLSKITLDYLVFESGLQPTALVADCWYVSSGTCPDLTAEFASIPLQEDGARKANIRIRIGFAKGSLATGQELTIQWGYHEQAYQRQFDESDDWSFTQANGQWNANPRVAVGSNGNGGTGAAMVWRGLVPGLPSTGKAGDVVHSQAQNASFVHDGTSWVLVSEIGKVGPQGPQGVAGPAGVPGATGATGPKGDKGDAGAGDDAALLQLVADLAARVGQLEAAGAAGPATMTDPRDGKVYRIVKIGTAPWTRTWMAENLDYAGTDGTLGLCHGDVAANCGKYGRLYGRLEALPTTGLLPGGTRIQGVCPDGWHVPDVDDWNELIGELSKVAGVGKEGAALKAAFGWSYSGSNGEVLQGNGIDAVGFRALAGGSHHKAATQGFSDLGNKGTWWGVGGAGVYRFTLDAQSNAAETVGLGLASQFTSYSLRCQKD